MMTLGLEAPSAVPFLRNLSRIADSADSGPFARCPSRQVIQTALPAPVVTSASSAQRLPLFGHTSGLGSVTYPVNGCVECATPTHLRPPEFLAVAV